MSCTVVIPVYNEAGSIEAVVRDVVVTLRGEPGDHRVLLLNDGSTDWSRALERRLLEAGPVEVESFRRNRGKGAMLDRAFGRLGTELTVILDADGEYLAADIPRILAPLRADEADWVMGSRYGFGRRRPRQYVGTYVVNLCISRLFFLLSGIPARDLLTGLYAFRTDLVRGIRLREARFSYTPELIWKVLRRRRARLLDVPIDYRFRSYAEGKKIRWWETGTILIALLRYRFPAEDETWGATP